MNPDRTRAEFVHAWEVVPDDEILFDGQVWYVTATAQLAMSAHNAKSFEITVTRDSHGYRRFRSRRSGLVARVVPS